MLVSLYSVTRHYGGPEEGGWYYDRRRFVSVECRMLGRDDARGLARELNDEAKAEHRQPSGTYQGRFRVSGGADDVYLVESREGEWDTTSEPRPQYC